MQRGATATLSPWPSQVLELQRRAGNRAVARRLQSAPLPQKPVLQRKLAVARTDTKDLPLFATLLAFFTRKAPFLGKTSRNHALYKALMRTGYRGHEAEILRILIEMSGDGTDRSYGTWLEAVDAANLERQLREAAKDRDPDAQKARKHKLSELTKATGSHDDDLVEGSLTKKQRSALAEQVPIFRREASVATDLFDLDVKDPRTSGDASSPKRKSRGDEEPDVSVPLGITRRKQHRRLQPLAGKDVRYRTYKGSISPLANAFVLGTLEAEYGPLLRKLVAAIALETKDEKTPLTDAHVAQLFLDEFAGKDAFGIFAPAVQNMAHKVIVIVFFAEFSRGSLALVTAAAAIHAVANRPEGKTEPSLVAAFDTESRSMRPLFAGTGGAQLLRGGDKSGIADEEERLVRAGMDLTNYFRANQTKGEEVGAFIRRRTLEIASNLLPHTEQAKLAVRTPVPLHLLKQVKRPRGTALETLVALGFTRRPQPGDENDCAIYTIHDQLTRRGVDVGLFAAFSTYVRDHAGLAFGTMIDILGNGAQLLAAVQTYLTAVRHVAIAPTLVVDAWSATIGGGLLEFQDVATGPAAGPQMVLTFYFDGVNHFDALEGGLARL